MPAPTIAGPRRRVRRAGILLMQCLVVLIVVAVTSATAIALQERSIRLATEERVLDVARSLAALDQVTAALLLPREAATAELQPLADLIEEAAGVDYVVITDEIGVRITHPIPDARGEVVSTDASAILAGETFVGTETGTLGPTLRAKVPIRSGDAIVGIASVGILEREIARDFETAIAGLLPFVLGSVLLGCIASALLTSVLNRRLRRLETQVTELAVQERIAGALREQTHEFRTQLHVVRGLVAQGESQPALEYLGRIVPIVGEGGAGADIADPTLRALLTALEAELAELGAELTVDPLTAVDATTIDDDELVVIANLCRNAGESGARRVLMVMRADHEGVHLVVDDDGPGVDAAVASRIFDRGVTTKPDVTGAGRGVGLDLVRRIVSSRGGTVEVGRSTLGGARFTVELPPLLSRAGASR